MAASRTNLRLVFQRREKITSLPLYYAGVLWKKSTRDKDFQRYWSEVRGSSIFFYCDENEVVYTEKLDLQKFVSIGDDNSRDKSSQVVNFRLQLANEEVKLKAEDLETREEWKGYISVVSQLKVPSNLSLLPGQMLRLNEVAEQEKERQSTSPVRPESESYLVQKPDPAMYDNMLSTMPACFYKISRNEAESMLERHPENGSLIIRPSTENTNYSVTTLTTQNSKGVIKHYRVTCEDSEFIIWLEYPVTCRTLQDVVDHFIKVTNGDLKPYLESNVYDKNIGQSIKAQMKSVPMSRVAPIQRSLVPPSDHPEVPAMMQKSCKSQPKLPLKQDLLKPAEGSSRSSAMKESEPSYMNNKGKGDTNELMMKLMKRRAKLAEDQ
uniref:signal-transducing adaptor protein 1-like isoform X2 n=1 Tax=Pristiophorus japonicus TaxID=55135 RepID=UPI00398EA24E